MMIKFTSITSEKIRPYSMKTNYGNKNSTVATKCAFWIVVHFALLVVFIILISSGSCSSKCVSDAEDSYDHHSGNSEVHYISHHLMKCKFADNNLDRIIPLVLYILFIFILVLWHETWIAITICQEENSTDRDYISECKLPVTILNWIGTILSFTGFYVLIAHDHAIMKQVTDECASNFSFNVTDWHFVGVALMFTGVGIVHVMTVLQYMLLNPEVKYSDENTVIVTRHGPRYRRVNYAVLDSLYFILILVFVVFFFTEYYHAAIITEYSIAVLIFLTSIYNLFIYGRIAHRIDC